MRLYTMTRNGTLLEHSQPSEPLYVRFAPGDRVALVDGRTGSVVEAVLDGTAYRVDTGEGDRRRIQVVDLIDLELVR